MWSHGRAAQAGRAALRGASVSPLQPRGCLPLPLLRASRPACFCRLGATQQVLKDERSSFQDTASREPQACSQDPEWGQCVISEGPFVCSWEAGAQPTKGQLWGRSVVWNLCPGSKGESPGWSLPAITGYQDTSGGDSQGPAAPGPARSSRAQSPLSGVQNVPPCAAFAGSKDGSQVPDKEEYPKTGTQGKGINACDVEFCRQSTWKGPQA